MFEGVLTKLTASQAQDTEGSLSLQSLQQAGLDFKVDGERLLVSSANKGQAISLSAEQRDYIQSHKAAIVEALKGHPLTRRRLQFRITLKAGSSFLQTWSAGVKVDEVVAFNEREWGPVELVEPLPLKAEDDRVCCYNCANLVPDKWLEANKGKVMNKCLAAKKLGIPGRYHPAGLDIPRRCVAFRERP